MNCWERRDASKCRDGKGKTEVTEKTEAATNHIAQRSGDFVTRFSLVRASQWSTLPLIGYQATPTKSAIKFRSGLV